MKHNRRVTNEQIIEAYKATGSVWKAAKRLGIIGQSVWERLERLGYKLPGRTWTKDELAELRDLAMTCSIGEIAQRLGRPYFGVAIKLSRLGIQRRGNKRPSQQPNAKLLSVTVAASFVAIPEDQRPSLRQFARTSGVALGTLVNGLHVGYPDVLRKIAAARGLTPKQCPNCHIQFIPLSAKQECCSQRCRDTRKRDLDYFGGNRKNTIGLAEGVCQVCFQKRSPLSSHHVFGKENDAENQVLIAVCSGCHKLVGHLASSPISDNPAAWESLISLALFRRHQQKHGSGIHVTVEWEWLTDEDVEALAEEMP